MKYEDARQHVRTGDVLGVHGTSLVSRLIEFCKGRGDAQAWSHIGVFYWSGDGLWVAQEQEGIGFSCYPASQLISQFVADRAVCYWGAAPPAVENNGSGVLDLISTYRVTPGLRPYGYGSLVRVLFDERTDPAGVQAVCSIFAQQAWERCGYKFATLLAPEDFKSLVVSSTLIQ